MLRRLLATFLLMIAVPVGAQPKRFFQHIGVEKGLHSYELIDISLDPQGFLWFGYPDAVSRFDGYSLREFTGSLTDTTDIAPSAAVGFGTDRHGNFYIGKADFGLQRWDPRTEHFHRYPFEDSSARSTKAKAIEQMLLDRDGRFWLGTYDGLRYLDESTGNFIVPTGQAKNAKGETIDALTLCQDSLDNIWYGGYGGFVSYNTKTGKVRSIPLRATTRPGHVYPVIYSVVADQVGHVWAATSNGLFRIDCLTGDYTEYKVGDRRHGLVSNFMRDVEVDRDGRIWVDPEHEGIQILDPVTGTFELYQHDPSDPSSLANNNVQCLYRDKHGLMWIGMGGYIDCYDPSSQRFDVYSNDPLDAHSVSNDVVRGMYEDKEGIIWLGTAGGGLNRYDPAAGTFDHFSHDASDPHSLSVDDVQDVTEDHDGNLWVATWGYGISRFNKRTHRWDNFPPIEGRKDRVSNITLTSLMTDRDGDIWISTWGTGVDRLDPKTGQYVNYRGKRGDTTTLPSNYTFCVTEDRKGDIWVGTSFGIARIDRRTGALRRYYVDTANRTGVNSGLVIHEDAKGRMWIGSHGLYQVNPQTGVFTAFGQKEGYPFNRAIGILEDSSGMLWIRTERGIVLFDPDSHNTIVYDRNDGILPAANSYGTMLHDSHGNLMFGSSGGLNIFRPSYIQSRSAAPLIALTSLVIGGVKRPAYPGSFKAESDQNSLDIEFAALSFNRPEKNRYRYQLEGNDHAWIDAGTRRFVTYTNLTPGQYLFRVRGLNEAGRWSANEASFQLTILPAWYQHWWFNMTILTLIVGFLYAGVRFRVRTIEYQKQQLERQVDQRTSEVNQQKAALERALADLKAAEVQMIQNEKMASLGQLTAGIAHELNNPINFVSSNIQPLKRDISDVLALLQLYMSTQAAGGVPEHIRQMQEELDIKVLLAEVSQLLKGIEEGATRTASIVKGLRNFSRLDQDALVLTNLNEGIESTLALLSSQLGSRITIVRKFSKLPLIECFPGQINQVFLNILTNAIQAIDGEGEITITTARQHDVVSVTIADNGQGMSAETIQKIFDPFYTTKSVGQGTGLGLSVSYGIIKKQGGSIEVASEVGKGSTFTIHLPLRLAEDTSPQSSIFVEREGDQTHEVR